MPLPASNAWLPIVLLIGSNLFMTVAWYGHLKHKAAPLLLAILVSWLIALPEYLLQVPANRIGHGYWSAPQLKGIQEIISLSLFALFSWWYLNEPLTARQAAAFVLIAIAAFLIVEPR